MHAIIINESPIVAMVVDQKKGSKKRECIWVFFENLKLEKNSKTAISIRHHPI